MNKQAAASAANSSPLFANSKQAASIYGGDSEPDMDGTAAEAELHRLQRQLRQLESERKQYTEETRATLNRQNGAMDKLKRDNEFLTQELRLLKLQLEDDSKTGPKSQRAESLKEQIDYLNQKMKETLNDIQKTDKLIAEGGKQLAKKRAAMGLTGSEVDIVKKQVSLMENRLDKAVIRFNKSLEHNAKLRDQIDVLRLERRAFDGAYKKFEKELLEKKKHMNEIIQQSTAAYETREEAQNRMVALKERAEKEHNAYLHELKELERQLDQDKKLREFMTTKNSERLDPVLHARKVAEDHGKTKGSQESLADKYTEFVSDFETLKQEAGTADLMDIVQKFNKMEDENFSVFNYVNEMNNQIQLMSEEISSMEQAIRKSSGDAETVAKKQKEKAKEVETEWSSAQQRHENYQKQINVLSERIGIVSNEIDKAYNVLQLPSVNQIDNGILGDKEKVILKKLRAVEEKTNELLMKNLLVSLPKKFSSAATADDNEAETMRDPVLVANMLHDLRKGTASHDGLTINPIIGNGPSAPVSKPRFNPAILSDEEDDEVTDHDEPISDIDERPFTRDEISQRARKTVATKLDEMKSKEADADLKSPELTRKALNQKKKRSSKVKTNAFNQ